MKYSMTFAEDVSCYATHNFEADSDEAAAVEAHRVATAGELTTRPDYSTGSTNLRIVDLYRCDENGEIIKDGCLAEGEPIDPEPDSRADLLLALREIAILAEYGTTGPDTNPPCKAEKMTAKQATALRGAISIICRKALGIGPARLGEADKAEAAHG